MDGTGRLVFSAVDMLDQMGAKYTVQRATRRWTIAMFYGVINIAAVNTLVIYANNMRKDQPEKNIRIKYFLLRIAHDLMTVCNTMIQTFYTS
jgi:hypothetical protein